MKARLLIVAAFCLLAGLSVQTLLAWTLFIRADYTGGTGVLNDPLLKPGERTATGFVVPVDWQSRTHVQWWGRGKTRETVSEARWLGSTLGIMSDGGRQATYNGFSAGWPMRSLGGCDYLTSGVTASAPGPLADVPAWINPGGHKVPVSPLWDGVAVNTLLFALPFFAAAWGAERVRRARRMREGLCLRCGYAVKNLRRCPECGDLAGGAKENA